jgi:nitrite reductase/ring-hydroxylating ferredoxin subunit
MAGSGTLLVRLADVPEGTSRGFTIETDAGCRDIFVVHKGGCIRAYVNSCPHTGGPLDWVPDQFLDAGGELIQCATHHALFRIEDGLCIAGPCAGDSLTPVAIAVRDGQIRLIA